jgi:CRISPR-associated protein Cas8a1/Csx13
MNNQSSAETELFRIALSAPGMTDIHRAGLGGLASSLRAMERAYRLRRLAICELPGDGITWNVTHHAVEFNIPAHGGAGEYLKRLFEFSFRVRNKFVDLPGVTGSALSDAVRAEHQLGLTLTFLQYGKHRDLGDASFRAVDPDGDGLNVVAFEFRPCDRFEHQDGWKLLVDKKGRLKRTPVATPSCFNPGAIVRHSHSSLTSCSEIKEPVGHALAACFAIVGCLSLPINRGVGVLVIPPVVDLTEFARLRPRMTPTSLRDCRVAGPADAALQTTVRLLASGALKHLGGEPLRVMQLRPTQWNKKQKSRTDVLTVRGADERLARRFDNAMRQLPRRLTLKRGLKEHDVMRDGSLVKVTSDEQIWVDSVVRPLIATNLALRRHWCHEFWQLTADLQSSKALEYERKGLHAMAKDLTVAETEQIESERSFIRAIHRAIYMARGKIYRDAMGEGAVAQGINPPESVKKRWKGLATEIRVGLLQAKTRALIQAAITKLLARTGVIQELKDREAADCVHRFVFHGDPDTVRNLALFALASYQKPEGKPALPGESDVDDITETDPDQE